MSFSITWTINRMATRNVLALSWILLIAYFVSGSQNAIVINPGRHICMKEEKSQKPVKTRETFCRPVYVKHLHMCERGGKYQLCASFRLKYELAYREKVVNEVHSRMVYTCCPGWKQRDITDTGCMEPVCQQECQNGGRCTGPNACTCNKGWTGRYCEIDVDECTLNGTICQHRCINTYGSYRCQCEDGFTLDKDGRSCTFCLTCLSEYDELVKGYKGLVKRVMQLENEKEELRRDMSLLADEQEKHLARLRNEVITVKSVMADMADKPTELPLYQENLTKMKKKNPDNNPLENSDHVVASPPDNYFKDRAGPRHQSTYSGASWDRLRSLSEQIAMLEERLEDCTCKYEKPRPPES